MFAGVVNSAVVAIRRVTMKICSGMVGRWIGRWIGRRRRSIRLLAIAVDRGVAEDLVVVGIVVGVGIVVVVVVAGIVHGEGEEEEGEGKA